MLRIGATRIWEKRDNRILARQQLVPRESSTRFADVMEFLLVHILGWWIKIPSTIISQNVLSTFACNVAGEINEESHIMPRIIIMVWNFLRLCILSVYVCNLEYQNILTPYCRFYIHILYYRYEKNKKIISHERDCTSIYLRGVLTFYLKVKYFVLLSAKVFYANEKSGYLIPIILIPLD